MSILTLYLLALLADYFLARSMATLDGPFGIFSEIRERIDPEQKTWKGRGLNCPICIGFYTSLAVVFLLLPYLPLGTDRVAAFVLHWLGLAGANMVLHLVIER